MISATMSDLPKLSITQLGIGVGILMFMLAVMLIGVAFVERRFLRPGGRVNGVVGRMGQGKSLFAVCRVMLPAHRAKVRIVTNFDCWLPGDCHPTQLDGAHLWEELQYVRDSIVVLDETHLYAPASQMGMLSEARWWCSMARKCGCDLWWISQNVMKIHKRLRDDSHNIWQVQKISPKWFMASQYETEEFGKQSAKRRDRKWYRLSKEAIRVYDSFELIPPYDEAGRKARKGEAWFVPWPRRVELLGLPGRVFDYVRSPIFDGADVPQWLHAWITGGDGDISAWFRPARYEGEKVPKSVRALVAARPTMADWLRGDAAHVDCLDDETLRYLTRASLADQSVDATISEPVTPKFHSQGNRLITDDVDGSTLPL